MLQVMTIGTLQVLLPLVMEGMGWEAGGSMGVQASLGPTERPEKEQYFLPHH